MEVNFIISLDCTFVAACSRRPRRNTWSNHVVSLRLTSRVAFRMHLADDPRGLLMNSRAATDRFMSWCASIMDNVKWVYIIIIIVFIIIIFFFSFFFFFCWEFIVRTLKMINEHGRIPHSLQQQIARKYRANVTTRIVFEMHRLQLTYKSL